MKAIFTLLLLVLFSVPALYSQSPNIISGDFKDLNVEEFIKELEVKASYRFFFEPSRFDSLRISLRAEKQSVESVITKAFENTDVKYTISGHNIFLTRGAEIITELPISLFHNKNPVNKSGSQVPISFAEVNEKQAPENRVTLENKLYEIGAKTAVVSQGNATLAGYVRNVQTGEPVIGVAVYIEKPRIGASTDQFGYYSITLPKGRHTLLVKGLGMWDTRRQIMLYGEGKLNIDLKEQVLSLREVVISAEKAANVNRVQMGVEKLTIKDIKQVPAVFGEADVLKVVLTLPGVKSVGEASTGFNVRGGSADQNLILFNDATIYNPSHFFGFFSAFNPDVVQDVELYKSSIPSKFGGRLSSVLDVSSREGNKKKLAGTAGIGLLTSRINVEGPIDKDKTSFILGARSTYSNWLLKMLPGKSGYKDAKASFYDVNLNLSHQFSEKDNLYLTGYISNDESNLASDTSYTYSNANASLKWKHVFNNKFFSVISGGVDRYEYQTSSIANPVNAYKLAFDINQYNFKADFNYFQSAKHTLNFGVNAIYYKLNPGTFTQQSAESLIVPQTIAAEQAVENALYVSDRYDISPAISVNLGLRYSLFNSLGPNVTNIYAPGVTREEETIIDTKTYKKGEVVQRYHGPEYRLSTRFAVTDDFSIKAGFNSMRQYIHMISNTTAISPTDIWKLSDAIIQPQQGRQVSLGFYKNFKSNTIETSVEVYYKQIKDYLDYKSGANLVLNPHIETDVINGKGKAYGAEFLLKKSTGKLNGWLSYTYSRILLKMDDANAGKPINEGNYYPANYDKPHDFSLIGNYRLSHRFSISLNAVYSTGRPITLPIAKFYYLGSERVYYSNRNQFRIPDYFRTDFSMNIEGNHKIHQLTHNSWTIGVYNLTGRKNAYSTYFTAERGVINGYKLSIFGSPVPFINYNIRF